MSGKPWSGKTVVIVDDSATVRDELKRIYESIGMTVVGFGVNGVEGVELTKKHAPDLVSLDVIMPEMDGIECFRKLRALGTDQKIVMISWLGADQKILENLKDTIPSHVFQAKPVTAMELEARLEYVYNPVGAAKAAAAVAAAAAAAKPGGGIKPTLDETAALMDLGIKVS